MKKVFLMLTVSLFSIDVKAATQECVDAPDCTELGYTQTAQECPNGAVKCPWNSGLVFCGCNENYQYSCTGTNESAGSDKCGDYYASCNCADGYKWEDGSCVVECGIGDIYYTDKTCTSAANYNSSKTVLGIVVYVTDGGKHGQIMAPWWVNTRGKKSSSGVGMEWGGYGTDIPSLPNYTSSSSAEADYNSCGNTYKILEAGSASTYPVAWATRYYAPTTETKGKWCLPAAGILRNIQNNQTAINTALNKIGGASNMLNYLVWSSSESSYNYAWSANLNHSVLYASGKNDKDYYVVPVLEF